MTIEDPVATLEPEASTYLADPLVDGWNLICTDPRLAWQDYHPGLVGRDWRLFGYGGCATSSAVFYSDDHGASWKATEGGWPPRYSGGAVGFREQLWLIGGAPNYADVWASRDPRRWTKLADRANVGCLQGTQVVAREDTTLYALGGADGSFAVGWVRCSTDGVRWEMLQEHAFPPRSNHAAAVLNGQLLVMGGEPSWTGQPSHIADVWVSDDGVNWTEHPVPWAARTGAVAVTLGNTLYLIGGGTDRTAYGDVWATPDAIRWTRVSTDGPGLMYAAATAVGDHIVTFGGRVDGEPTPNVWAYKPPPTGWWATLGHSAIAGVQSYAVSLQLGGKIWLLSGPENPTLWSCDGVEWNDAKGNLPYRQMAAGCVHEGRLWVCGGDPQTRAGRYSREVWSSQDGGAWTLVTDSAPWQARRGHCMASFAGRMWVVCGKPTSGGWPVDLWSSTDGAVWKQEATPPFSPRENAQAVIFGSELWLLGGQQLGSCVSEAWSLSATGAWTRRTVPWTPRFDVTAKVVGETLYVIGGGGNGRGRFPDVWATRDGLTWTQASNSAPGARGGGSAVLDERIILFGGNAWTPDPDAISEFLTSQPQTPP